jgi:hypothetical protein
MLPLILNTSKNDTALHVKAIYLDNDLLTESNLVA